MKGGKEESLQQQIRDIFKVLVPILKNQRSTIITPLLATGRQVKEVANITSHSGYPTKVISETSHHVT